MNRRRLVLVLTLLTLWSGGGEASSVVLSSHVLQASLDQTAPCTSGITAFQNTVYAKITRDCKLCHDGSNAAAPAYDSGDLTQTYFSVSNYVDFQNPETSTFVVRAGNGHCGLDNCDTASGADMLTQVKAWWDQGQKTCQVNGKYFTAELPVPADLPEKTAWTLLQWDLSTVSLNLTGFTFGIDAQYLLKPSATNAGAYRFRKPRLLTGNRPVHVNNIKILINRGFNPIDNIYTIVDRIVSPQHGPAGEAAPYPTLSADTLITIPQTASDKLSIAFDVIQLASSVPCKALDNFTDNIFPYFRQGTCFSCHGGEGGAGTSPANVTYNMDLPNDQLCQGVRERVDFSDAIQSPFLSFGARGKFDHPQTLPNPDTFAQDFLTWTQAEAAQPNSLPH